MTMRKTTHNRWKKTSQGNQKSLSKLKCNRPTAQCTWCVFTWIGTKEAQGKNIQKYTAMESTQIANNTLSSNNGISYGQKNQTQTTTSNMNRNSKLQIHKN